MNLPTFCIKRPVFATVLSLILVVMGIMGYQNLQTRFFPRFQQDKVFITTTYPGASAKLVESTITTPLEKAISGIDGIDDTFSISSQGGSKIVVDLKPEDNTYDVTSKIRNQIAMAASTLPNTIQAPIVQMGYGSMELMDIGFGITGNHLKTLRDYLDRNVIDRIEQLPGVSYVGVTGANKYAMRITLRPNQMTARGVSISDITQAIANNNLQLPAGNIETPTMEFPITAKTALHTPEQFGNIVVKDNNGQPIYLRDIANIKLGGDIDTKTIVRVNGNRSIILTIYPANSANPITVSNQIHAVLNHVKTQLPSDIHFAVTFDQANYMKASISEVYKSILLAILFVAIIIFLFLGKIRSSLIPIITIPICIFATTGLMYFMGFSINMITLLAIVLSIGLVVDDAIVVLENIYRHIESGMSRMDAAILGSKEIATPVIAMTLTLAAVYAPIGLIKGVVAHIFASFAFTLAGAVIISGFVALTLSPMMCSKFLSNTAEQSNAFSAALDRFFHRVTFFYQKILSVVLSHRFKTVIITLFFVIAGFVFISGMPKAFLPKEDMGFVITLLNSPTGTSYQTAEKQIQNIDKLLSKNKNIHTTVSLSLQDSSNENNDLIFSTLKNYSERSKNSTQIAGEINAELSKIPGLNTTSFSPSFGGSIQSAISFYIMAPENYSYLYHVGLALTDQLNKTPGLLNVRSNMQFNNQQYNLTVNRPLANQLQVNVSSIDNTIADLLGGANISTFSTNGETYNVDIQAEKSYLQSVQGISQFTVPNNTGKLIPLADLIDLTPVNTQTDLFHYNRLRAAKITAEVTPGFSYAQAVDNLQSTLPKLLPAEVKFAFTGQAERVVNSSNSLMTIFLLAFVFIYLVLSAQFESFLDPLIILLAVPLSMIGALVSLKCVGGSINLYTMIGLVTLVGLISKHGILITQFANKRQESGENAHDALIHAASIRLRPILMTTAAMIFGALPLIFATGASAVSREQIGTVFVGGLFFGTFFSLILVPISYSYFAQLKNWIKEKRIKVGT